MGYKGLLGDRVLLAADAYYSRVENFVGPLRVITPNVFFDPASLQAFVTGRLAPLIQAGLLSAQDVATIVATAAALPLGTVVPDQVDNGDLLVTYRNFGAVDFFGVDLSAEILASDRLSITANYSHQSDECFDFNEDGDCTSTNDIALNAPSHKGSLGLTFDDPGLRLFGAGAGPGHRRLPHEFRRLHRQCGRLRDCGRGPWLSAALPGRAPRCPSPRTTSSTICTASSWELRKSAGYSCSGAVRLLTGERPPALCPKHAADGNPVTSGGKRRRQAAILEIVRKQRVPHEEAVRTGDQR